MARKRTAGRVITQDGYAETGIYRRKLTAAERKKHGLKTPDDPTPAERKRNVKEFARRAERSPTNILDELAAWLLDGLRVEGYIGEAAPTLDAAIETTTAGGPLLVGAGADAIAYATLHPIERGTQAGDAAEALEILRDIQAAVAQGNAGIAAVAGIRLGKVVERLGVRPFESNARQARELEASRARGGKASAKLTSKEWQVVALAMKKATAGRGSQTAVAAADSVAKQLATGTLRGVSGRRNLKPDTIRRDWRKHLP